MTATKSTSKEPIAPDKGKTIRFIEMPGISREKMLAMLAVDGAATNAYTMSTFCRASFGDLDLTDAIDVLRDGANAANAGDLRAAVTMLSSQAAALNAMFGELARRSALNMGEYIDASERYMRLALKAQGQCRATLETLAAIKNPPVVFARQANINNGGQQQVNNGSAAPATTSSETNTRISAHAGKTQSEPSKLLEASDVERLDPGAQGAAGSAHQDLEAVGMLIGAKDSSR